MDEDLKLKYGADYIMDVKSVDGAIQLSPRQMEYLIDYMVCQNEDALIEHVKRHAINRMFGI